MANNIDLSDYNLAELKGLQFEIDNEIRLRRLDEVTRARADILAIASKAGVSVDDLLLNPAGKPKRA
jgi:DNA-binding protein H-NS